MSNRLTTKNNFRFHRFVCFFLSKDHLPGNDDVNSIHTEDYFKIKNKVILLFENSKYP